VAWATSIPSSGTKKVIELRPRNYNNHKNLAILYEQMGRIDDAIREATEALNLAPQDQKAALQSFIARLGGPQVPAENEERIAALVEQGRAQMDAEQWGAAEATFLQVVELNPNHPQAHSALAYVYAKQGRVDEAIAENQIVVRLVPGDYNSYKNLGLLYQQKGDLAQAISAIEQALALAPEKDKDPLQVYLDQLKQLQGESSPTAEPAQRAGDLAPQARNQMYTAPPPMIIDPAKSYRATIVTAKGNIVVDLAVDDAPQTVNNFVYLSREGFYDSLTFHRVESSAGFSLIQGGDPAGNGTGGPGYTVPAEIGLPHNVGAIATARTGDQVNPERASSGSQFYICLEPIHQLDGGYTVFGYVQEGLDVAKSIAVGDEILTIVITEE
jgi:peptidyl-prolyl cis-trans isomerase B (cyclophilin B)